MGAEQDLVAVDLSSTYPEQIKKLPNVGYHRALSAEGIISMKPTLVLHDGSIGPEAVIGQVKTVGIPMLEMKAGRVFRKRLFFERTKVLLKKMHQDDIQRYFRRVDPLDKAGAYAIQDRGAGIVRKVKGSFTNAVGLPMERLRFL